VITLARTLGVEIESWLKHDTAAGFDRTLGYHDLLRQRSFQGANPSHNGPALTSAGPVARH
jgi:hypothetical protein